MSREMPGFLTVDQVAKRYQRSHYWVYHCKALNPYRRKIGKYLMFLEDDLLKFEQPKVILDGAQASPDQHDIDREFTKREKQVEIVREEKPVSRCKFDML